jgi:hypothetical protein
MLVYIAVDFLQINYPLLWCDLQVKKYVFTNTVKVLYLLKIGFINNLILILVIFKYY